MKSFNEFISENNQDMIKGYHGKKVPIKTHHFNGEATLEFDHIKRGKHKTHVYRVHYNGIHVKDNEKAKGSGALYVDHNDGVPYNHKTHSGSSKDLSAALHKGAPQWVTADDLKLKFK